MDIIESIKKHSGAKEAYKVDRYEVWIDMVPIDVEIRTDADGYTVNAQWLDKSPANSTMSHHERDLDTAIATVRWPSFKDS